MDYKKLIVWQKAMELTEKTYQLIRLLPREENYALADQMRRAVISIPSNIAEGSGRSTDNEFSRFLAIANGSRTELETQLELCILLNYISRNQCAEVLALSEEIGKMLNVLMKKVKENG